LCRSESTKENAEGKGMMDEKIGDELDAEMYQEYMKMSDYEKDVFMSVRLICKETFENGGNLQDAIKTHSQKTGIPAEVLENRVQERLLRQKDK